MPKSLYKPEPKPDNWPKPFWFFLGLIIGVVVGVLVVYIVVLQEAVGR